MSAAADEASRLRIQDVTLSDSLSQIEQDPSLGMPCMAAQTKVLTSYPRSAQQFYACSPVTVLGHEVEGGTGTLTAIGSTFFGLNLGSAVPPVGTIVLTTFVDHRWVFRYDG
jgi:hypothetical protein